MTTELTDHHDKMAFAAFMEGWYTSTKGFAQRSMKGWNEHQKQCYDRGYELGISDRKSAIDLGVKLSYVGPQFVIVKKP